MDLPPPRAEAIEQRQIDASAGCSLWLSPVYLIHLPMCPLQFRLSPELPPSKLMRCIGCLRQKPKSKGLLRSMARNLVCGAGNAIGYECPRQPRCIDVLPDTALMAALHQKRAADSVTV